MSEEQMLSGAFIKSWKVIKRGKELESNFKWIKITEIKIIESLSENACVFHTYKDCKFYTELPEDQLRKAINMFLFKQDDYYYDYVEGRE